MPDRSKIEWTDTTWNVVTGCSKVSTGCRFCYAEAVAKRLWRGRPFGDVQVHQDRIYQPLSWKKPRRVFVNSMSDLFHEAVSYEMLDSIFAVMLMTQQHQYQVLTKRPTAMRDYMRAPETPRRVRGNREGPPWKWPPRNVWLGSSIENQATANERIPHLLTTPAAVRFVSAEPLLAPVVLPLVNWDPGIDWIIVGGESGPQARICGIQWIEQIVRDARATMTPVFVKQLGRRPVSVPPPENAIYDPTPLVLSDAKGGDPEEWPEHLRVRQFPEARS